MIQDSNRLYSLLRRYADFSLFKAYRKVEYHHLERIPDDGAVIYAPNHTNALMDALLVLCIDKKPTVFVSRADIFKNRIFARILHFFKILPIMRIRDGLDAVRKNDRTIATAVSVLKSGVPFCILPEGTHRGMHSLLPLLKGIFRIALEAQESIPEKPVYILPVGLEYGNYRRFRTTVHVDIGRPLHIGEFTGRHPGLTRPELINALRTELTARMKETILYIPADEHYEATYEICAAVVNDQIRRLTAGRAETQGQELDIRLAANKQTVAEIQQWRATDPQKSRELFRLAGALRAARLKCGISLHSVAEERPGPGNGRRLALLILTAPYTVAAGILSLPLSLLTGIVLMFNDDPMFNNSFRYIITLICWPFAALVYTLLAFHLLDGIWCWIATIAIWPAHLIAQDSYRALRLAVSGLKLALHPGLKQQIKQLRQRFAE